MKILLVDIETAPNVAYVWGLWQQNVAISQLIDSGYILCWSAKWFGEKEVLYGSIHSESPRSMLRRIHKLLDAADMVVHYHGTKFDIPTLNKEFVLYNMKPPAPYKQVDLLKVVRDKFRFASNKLDYVCQQFGLGKKTNTSFELWVKCMENDPEAWATMEKYNKNDVLLLEKLYVKLLPWIKGHANRSIYEDVAGCPNCSSRHLQKRGFYYTTTLKYQRYCCKNCGNWFRGGKSVGKGPEERYINV